jgi:hypothetical protein
MNNDDQWEGYDDDTFDEVFADLIASIDEADRGIFKSSRN